MSARVSAWKAHGIGFVLALAGALAFAGPASAQFGEAAGIGEAMQPDYYKRDVVIISQGLQLDEAQRAILNSFFEDYTSAFESGLDRMKKRFDDMKDELQTGDKDRIMKMVFAPFKDWAGEKLEIGAQFLANIEVVLTEDQQKMWPGVKRQLYRERNLHKGRLSGETTNLVDVVRDMNLDPRVRVQIQPIMEAYEIALDRALHNREDPIAGRNNPVLQALEDQDASKSQEVLKKHIAREVEVRNVNDNYIEQIAMALPENLAREFRAAALDRAYPRVYRETPVQRIFSVAVDLDGLDPGIRQSVQGLQGEFLSELAAINQQLLDALRAYEPVEAEERAADFARRMAGQQIEPKPDPTREMFARREEMSRNYVKRLKSMLTEAQFAALPGAYRWIDAPEPGTNAPPKNIKKEINSLAPGKGGGKAGKEE